MKKKIELTEETPWEHMMLEKLDYLLDDGNEVTEHDYEVADVIGGFSQYGVQSEMEAYTEKHPKASWQEILRYFCSITPDCEIIGD